MALWLPAPPLARRNFRRFLEDVTFAADLRKMVVSASLRQVTSALRSRLMIVSFCELFERRDNRSEPTSNP